MPAQPDPNGVYSDNALTPFGTATVTIGGVEYEVDDADPENPSKVVQGTNGAGVTTRERIIDETKTMNMTLQLAVADTAIPAKNTPFTYDGQPWKVFTTGKAFKAGEETKFKLVARQRYRA